MTRTLRSHAALTTLALATAAALALSACAGAGSATTSAPAVVPSTAVSAAPAGSAADVYRVTLGKDQKLGDYLVGEDGKALYLFTKDTKDTPTCAGQCAAAWPPFELEGAETVAAGDGVSGALATVVRADDGKRQVTYNGIPLYYFAKDAAAADTRGQGLNGVWFLVGTAATAANGPITGGLGQTGSATAAPAASSDGGAASASPGSVQIANFAFAPASLTVKVGTTVTWTNGDGASHTVTADDGSFDSGSVGGGATFKQTFAKAGTFAYHCAIHRSMTASITVAP